MVGMSDDVTVVLALKRLREAKSRLAGHTPSPQAREALVGELGEKTYRALAAAVADFDFERALALLDRPGRANVAH